jgi:hypothetical protein
MHTVVTQDVSVPLVRVGSRTVLGYGVGARTIGRAARPAIEERGNWLTWS